MKKNLEKIAREDGRFSPRAARFVYEGLGYTDPAASSLRSKTAGAAEVEHVTGQALCDGLRRLALEKWGRLSMLVLNSWNIKTTRDFGEIVYLMIRHRWMKAQPTDSIDDFNDVYDFEAVFKEQFKWTVGR